MMGRYDGILFDMDGVLLTRGDGDWWPLVEQAAASALHDHGIRECAPEYDQLKHGLANSDPDTVETYLSGYDVDAETLWQTRKTYDVEIQQSQLADPADSRRLHADTAVIDLLHETHDLGVVSNNAQGFVDHVMDETVLVNGQLSQPGLDAYFEAAYGVPHETAALEHKKPDPYFLEQAVDDLNAETVLYVGDKENDIVAAQRAGIDAAFVPHDRQQAEKHVEDFDVQPMYAVDDLYELAAL